MKTIALTAIVLIQIGIINAQNVTIPDANFKNALIEEGVDANHDGEISYAEAEVIKELKVHGKNITNMTGIEAFINLDTLLCHANQITNLDVSDCTALEYLECSNNPLKSLNISGCPALATLKCEFGQLTSLDVTNNTELVYLGCTDNHIISLDVTNNTQLVYLFCSINQLTSLDVSNNTGLLYLYLFENQLTSLDLKNNINLEYLVCSHNNLTRLDVSGCIALIELTCHNNQLTKLNVSNNTVLAWLTCRGNQLKSLDISKNTALEILDISSMQNLFMVCVWEMPFPYGNIWVNITGSPNVYFTTDCSTGIQEYKKEEIKTDICPNPTDDIVTIEIGEPNNASIEIYNSLGRLIFRKVATTKTEQIYVSAYTKGIYFIKVKHVDRIYTEKVVVR